MFTFALNWLPSAPPRLPPDFSNASATSAVPPPVTDARVLSAAAASAEEEPESANVARALAAAAFWAEEYPPLRPPLGPISFKNLVRMASRLLFESCPLLRMSYWSLTDSLKFLSETGTSRCCSIASSLFSRKSTLCWADCAESLAKTVFAQTIAPPKTLIMSAPVKTLLCFFKFPISPLTIVRLRGG